jgi:hypothetical protein
VTGDPCSSTVVPVSCVRCSVLTPIHFVMPFSSVSHCVLTPMGAPNEGGQECSDCHSTRNVFEIGGRGIYTYTQILKSS